MNLPTPIGIEGESPQALRAFAAYIKLGHKRSLVAVARRLAVSRSLCSRWSRRNNWIARLRAMESEAAIAENQRAAEADRKAKEETAQMIERERLRFVRREIAAAEKATEIALRILNQPFVDLTPDAAAKLFSVAHAIGSSALGLPGANLAVQGLGGAPPANIVVNVTRDATSDKVRRIQYDWLKAHMDHPQAERYIAQYEREYLPNGEPRTNGNSE